MASNLKNLLERMSVNAIPNAQQELSSLTQQEQQALIEQQKAYNVSQAQSSVNSQITNTQAEMLDVGVDPTKFTDTRNPIEKVFNVQQNQNWLFDIFEVIQRPQQAIFSAIEADQTGKDPGEEFMKGLTGNRDIVYGGQLLRNAGAEDNIITDIIGFGLDIFADPADIPFIPVSAATKAGKGISTVARKADDILDASKAMSAGYVTKLLNKTDKIDDVSSYIARSITSIDDYIQSAEKLGKVDLAEKLGRTKSNLFSSLGDAKRFANEIPDSAKGLAKEIRDTTNMLEPAARESFLKTIGDSIQLVKPEERFVSVTDLVMRSVWGGAKGTIKVADNVALNLATQYGSGEFYKSLRNGLLSNFAPKAIVGKLHQKYLQTYGSAELAKRMGTEFLEAMSDDFAEVAQKLGMEQDDLERLISMHHTRLYGQNTRTAQSILEGKVVFPYTKKGYDALTKHIVLKDGEKIGDVLPVFEHTMDGKKIKIISLNGFDTSRIVKETASKVELQIPNLLTQSELAELANMTKKKEFIELAARFKSRLGNLYDTEQQLLASGYSAQVGYIRNTITEAYRESKYLSWIADEGANSTGYKTSRGLTNAKKVAQRKLQARSTVEANRLANLNMAETVRYEFENKLKNIFDAKNSDYAVTKAFSDVIKNSDVTHNPKVKDAIMDFIKEKGFAENTRDIINLILDSVDQKALGTQSKGLKKIVYDYMGTSGTSLQKTLSVDDYNILVRAKKSNPDVLKNLLGNEDIFNEIGNAELTKAQSQFETIVKESFSRNVNTKADLQSLTDIRKLVDDSQKKLRTDLGYSRWNQVKEAYQMGKIKDPASLQLYQDTIANMAKRDELRNAIEKGKTKINIDDNLAPENIEYSQSGAEAAKNITAEQKVTYTNHKNSVIAELRNNGYVKEYASKDDANKLLRDYFAGKLNTEDKSLKGLVEQYGWARENEQLLERNQKPFENVRDYLQAKADELSAKTGDEAARKASKVSSVDSRLSDIKTSELPAEYKKFYDDVDAAKARVAEKYGITQAEVTNYAKAKNYAAIPTDDMRKDIDEVINLRNTAQAKKAEYLKTLDNGTYQAPAVTNEGLQAEMKAAAEAKPATEAITVKAQEPEVVVKPEENIPISKEAQNKLDELRNLRQKTLEEARVMATQRQDLIKSKLPSAKSNVTKAQKAYEKAIKTFNSVAEKTDISKKAMEATPALQSRVDSLASRVKLLEEELVAFGNLEINDIKNVEDIKDFLPDKVYTTVHDASGKAVKKEVDFTTTWEYKNDVAVKDEFNKSRELIQAKDDLRKADLALTDANLVRPQTINDSIKESTQYKKAKEAVDIAEKKLNDAKELQKSYESFDYETLVKEQTDSIDREIRSYENTGISSRDNASRIVETLDNKYGKLDTTKLKSSSKEEYDALKELGEYPNKIEKIDGYETSMKEAEAKLRAELGLDDTIKSRKLAVDNYRADLKAGKVDHNPTIDDYLQKSKQYYDARNNFVTDIKKELVRKREVWQRLADTGEYPAVSAGTLFDTQASPIPFPEAPVLTDAQKLEQEKMIKANREKITTNEKSLSYLKNEFLKKYKNVEGDSYYQKAKHILTGTDPVAKEAVNTIDRLFKSNSDLRKEIEIALNPTGARKTLKLAVNNMGVTEATVAKFDNAMKAGMEEGKTYKKAYADIIKSKVDDLTEKVDALDATLADIAYQVESHVTSTSGILGNSPKLAEILGVKADKTLSKVDIPERGLYKWLINTEPTMIKDPVVKQLVEGYQDLYHQRHLLDIQRTSEKILLGTAEEPGSKLKPFRKQYREVVANRLTSGLNDIKTESVMRVELAKEVVEKEKEELLTLITDKGIEKPERIISNIKVSVNEFDNLRSPEVYKQFIKEVDNYKLLTDTELQKEQLSKIYQLATNGRVIKNQSVMLSKPNAKKAKALIDRMTNVTEEMMDKTLEHLSHVEVQKLLPDGDVAKDLGAFSVGLTNTVNRTPASVKVWDMQYQYPIRYGDEEIDYISLFAANTGSFVKRYLNRELPGAEELKLFSDSPAMMEDLQRVFEARRYGAVGEELSINENFQQPITGLFDSLYTSDNNEIFRRGVKEIDLTPEQKHLKAMLGDMTQIVSGTGAKAKTMFDVWYQQFWKYKGKIPDLQFREYLYVMNEYQKLPDKFSRLGDEIKSVLGTKANAMPKKAEEVLSIIRNKGYNSDSLKSIFPRLSKKKLNELDNLFKQYDHIITKYGIDTSTDLLPTLDKSITREEDMAQVWGNFLAKRYEDPDKTADLVTYLTKRQVQAAKAIDKVMGVQTLGLDAEKILEEIQANSLPMDVLRARKLAAQAGVKTTDETAVEGAQLATEYVKATQGIAPKTSVLDVLAKKRALTPEEMAISPEMIKRTGTGVTEPITVANKNVDFALGGVVNTGETETEAIQRLVENLNTKYLTPENALKEVPRYELKSVSDIAALRKLILDKGADQKVVNNLDMNSVNEIIQNIQENVYKRAADMTNSHIESLESWKESKVFEENLRTPIGDWISVFANETRGAQVYEAAAKQMLDRAVGGFDLHSSDSLLRWQPYETVAIEDKITGKMKFRPVKSSIASGYVPVTDVNGFLSQLQSANKWVQSDVLTDMHKKILDFYEEQKATISKLRADGTTKSAEELTKEVSEKMGNFIIERNVASMLSLDLTKESSDMLKLAEKSNELFKRFKILNPAFNIKNNTGLATNLALSGYGVSNIPRGMADAKYIFDRGAQLIKLRAKSYPDPTAWTAYLLKNSKDARVYTAYTTFLGNDFKEIRPLKKALEEGIMSNGVSGSSIMDINNLPGLNVARATRKDASNFAKLMNPIDTASIANAWANETMDSTYRMMVLAKALDDPKYMERLGVESPAEAVRLVMFDPKNLSPFELKVMRKIVPFYTFTKMNLIYHMTNIPNNAVRYHRMAKAVNASWNLAGISRDDVDDYKLNQMYVPMIGANENGKYYALKLGLPQAEAAEFISNPLEKATSMVTPLIRAPFEVATGSQAFTGRPIENFKGEKSTSLPFLTKNQEYLLGQTGVDVPIRSLYGLVKTAQGDIAGGVGQFTGMLSQGNTINTSMAKRYDVLENLQDGVKVLKQEGTILPNITVNQNPVDEKLNQLNILLNRFK